MSLKFFFKFPNAPYHPKAIPATTYRACPYSRSVCLSFVGHSVDHNIQ